MPKLIDFECMFRDYLAEYHEKHEIAENVLEEIVPELYLRWLEKPLDDLDGKSPCGYFEEMSGPDLILLLGQYFFSDLQIPGALLNRIGDTKEEMFPYVHALLQNYEGERGDEFRTILVQIIEEMEMPHPYEYYISVIAAAEAGSDFSEACVDALKCSGDTVRGKLMEAFEDAASEYAEDCFLDILADLPYDERVYTQVLDMFLCTEGKRAFYASCLGKLGNEKALPYLEETLKDEGLTYFEYISIKNALEELGGEVDLERDFVGDKDYEALVGAED